MENLSEYNINNKAEDPKYTLAHFKKFLHL